jgi:hypothetical protein
MNGFCSPSNEMNKYCFTETSLRKMVIIWNIINKNKIKCKSVSDIYKALQTKLKPHVYWLWCGVMERMAEKKINTLSNQIKTQKTIKAINQLTKAKKDLRMIAKKNLRPEKPESWYKNPKTWLSNYDIQNVMFQYSDCKKYKYAFLGVFPIDFTVASVNGVCLYSEFCHINIKDYIKRGKKFIGLITNLDKHDESGSHWTSTFMVIDPSLQTYGAYYYDSTGNSIPSYLNTFLQDVKKQCDTLYPHIDFNINLNKKQHQYKNTECGVFSMVFQIRWINKHIVKKNNTSFEEILGNPYIDDDHMLKIRDTLYRPNTKMELKKFFAVKQVDKNAKVLHKTKNS